ncbi:hypothetical protein AX16_009952 [Volvariella volvacea WC 439]|nr:hypothetical protein AX16_009952 [Volvariella volvacea WC 439]
MKANQQGSSGNLYVQYLSRDISKIVESVVPPGREGLPNLISTKQILQNWRTKRVIETSKLDDALSILDSRTSLAQAPDSSAPASSSSNNHAHHHHHRSLERHEVLRRIEEDRERHKRLRERRWVQPVSYNNPLSSFQPPPLASFLPLTDPDPADGQGELLPIDIEFENEWETTSDWNEDDDEAALEEAELCFPAEGEGPMDLS